VASALVRRPHDGQRIEPDVLRNIVRRIRLDAILFVEPPAEVDEATCQSAEGPMRVVLPVDGRTARRTTIAVRSPRAVIGIGSPHFAVALAVDRPSSRGIVLACDKLVNLARVGVMPVVRRSLGVDTPRTLT
jgi:hypothetical protein